MSAAAMRNMAMLPENRPAMQLLLRSTMAMAGIPIAVYYFCFEAVFGEKGWIDMSHDLNWRVNYSAFAAIAAVQASAPSPAVCSHWVHESPRVCKSAHPCQANVPATCTTARSFHELGSEHA